MNTTIYEVTYYEIDSVALFVEKNPNYMRKHVETFRTEAGANECARRHNKAWWPATVKAVVRDW